jgi:hypothetical protein
VYGFLSAVRKTCQEFQENSIQLQRCVAHTVYGNAINAPNTACRGLHYSLSSSFSDQHADYSRTSSPIDFTSNIPPHRSTSRLARLRRTTRRRRTRTIPIVRRFAHIRNPTTILPRHDEDLARRIRAHEQATLGIPCKANRSEARARASGEIRVRDDVGGGSGTVRGSDRRTIAVELDKAQLVADGLFAVPTQASETYVEKSTSSYHEPCIVTQAAVPFGLNLISRGAM